ncbi:hypothetical protein PJI16_15935 [Nitrospira sp. MA-1]|nr:hypothetical protein [Nitrospira sp. MA-1]
MNHFSTSSILTKDLMNSEAIPLTPRTLVTTLFHHILLCLSQAGLLVRSV